MNTKALEEKLVEINKNLPQIPKNGKDMLAKYFWIVAIIGAVFNIMAVISILGVGTLGSALIGGLGYGAQAASLWVNIALTSVGLGAVAVIEIMSVSPLKKQVYRGWKLALYAVLLQFAVSVVIDLISGHAINLVSTVVVTAIGLYLLTQIHDYFVDKKSKKESAKKSTAKA